MQATPTYIKVQKEGEIANISKRPFDCREILDTYGLTFSEQDPYLQVGELPSTNWVLYISVIRLQFSSLLNEILPILIEEKVTFRIPKDKDTARKMLDGSLGILHLAKIICIYPQQTDQLIRLAKVLVSLTQHFRGPVIPTERALGGCLYTQQNAIQSQEADWPFADLSPFKLPTPKPLFNYKYKPLAIIKPDIKGRVIQANYFKSLFNIKLCIIKEGIKNMWADEFGRDIVDRLKWQYELYSDLASYVSTPKIFDFFEEQGNTYLTMEFIKGESLSEKVQEIYTGQSWFNLSKDKRLSLINYYLNILYLIYRLHERGYVHRDVTPGNFIINKNEEIFLIDMELTYSLKREKPNPAFKQGTPGYMSNEQIIREMPTIKEDIYALGALMIFIFTGISPSKIDTRQNEALSSRLSFFTENSTIINLIQKCLSDKPENRPVLLDIKQTLENYQTEIRTDFALKTDKYKVKPLETTELNKIICNAIETLIGSQTITLDDIWVCRKEEDSLVGIQNIEQVTLPGLYRGIAGFLFVLARAKRLGYNIDFSLPTYYKNWEYLKNQYLNNSSDIEYGLFRGLAGIGLAINEGMRANLLTNENQASLQACFKLAPSINYDLANGVAGQGLAILQCHSNLDPEFSNSFLNQIANTLLQTQQKDGSWITSRHTGRKNDHFTGLAHGSGGIINFLIAYARHETNAQVITSIQHGLRWLQQSTIKNKGKGGWPVSTKSKTIDTNSIAIGMPGIILTFIKAYELLKDPIYQEIAESALCELPKQPINVNFTQLYGLSGLGEVYFEAYRVFRTGEWLERQHWITGIFANTLLSGKKMPGYWSVNAFPDFEGDLMTGSAGIIHFLMRTQVTSTAIGHPLVG